MSKPFNPFTSKRLLYRAVEDNSEDEEFVHNIQKDAEAQSGAMYRRIVPENKKASNKIKESLLDKGLLNVIVCLPSDTANPVPIGILTLSDLDGRFAHHRHTYVGIDILAPYRGEGYGGEVIEWSLGYAFRIAGMHRVGIQAFSYNQGAMRLYEKLGFVLEGRNREEVWFDGEWHDNVTFGMLEGEWREKLKREGRQWRE